MQKTSKELTFMVGSVWAKRAN